ncbi:MAG: radical SAM protein [Oscillospiraceae bacterium]|nr:radical SAM protein [Oscillospiraceae bacterium]
MKALYNPLTNGFEPSNNDCLLPQIMWHITDYCYLNCKTCFVKERKLSGLRRSCGEMLRNFPLLKQLGVQKIDLSGGEPLLFEGLPELVEHARQEGFYLTITTRGVGTKENREWLYRNWMKFSRVILSLDGGNAQTCDFYSGYSGTFSHTVDTCLQLNKHGCDRLRINTVVNQCILDTPAQTELLDLVSALEPKEWCIIEPHPSNKTNTFDQYAVTGEEYERFLKYILSEFKSEQTKVLQRRKTMYGTYWALYPDNMICRLSGNEDASFSVKFSEENLKSIVEMLEQSIQLLP